MPYQHYFKCSVCDCKETISEQFGDGAAEFCLECGMPIESFIEDLNATIIGVPDAWKNGTGPLPFTAENGDCTFMTNGDLR